MSDFVLIEQKMRRAGIAEAAIEAFRHSVQVLQSGAQMMIPEAEIQPAEGVMDWETAVNGTAPADAELLRQLVVIKLNGGLGTSMGLQKAKSLLEIKPGLTFLDTIVRQVRSLRKAAGCSVRLLLMNSFSTSADTLTHLQRYAEEGFGDAAQVEMMQNRVPKLLVDTLAPAEYPEAPELEWCPPGHGDLYAALVGSGRLVELLAAGVKYAFISNSDNLGAQPDTRFLRCFAESGAPFVMEVTRRTEADRKGGHLATRRSDGQLLLRETAQCLPEDAESFSNIEKHRYFNTNNLWLLCGITWPSTAG